MKKKVYHAAAAIWGVLALVLIACSVQLFVLAEWPMWVIWLLTALFGLTMIVMVKGLSEWRMQMVNHLEEMCRYKKFSDSRYRMMARLSDDVTFEFDLVHQTISDSTNWDVVASGSRFIYGSLERKIVHPDDAGLFLDYFTGPVTVGELKEMEIRLINKPGGPYQWTQIRSVVLGNEDGRPEKLLGRRFNIDKQKREQEALKEQAEHDLLTGLYNKMVSEQLIGEALSETENVPCYLLLIDIDHFKDINDTLGHHAGDDILKEFADLIDVTFGKNDIKGRTGGDEFIVFMKRREDGKNQAAACCVKLQELLKELSSALIYHYPVTCSAGIAAYPADGKDYQTLFGNADQALYEVKRGGRNHWKFYQESEV